MVNQEGKEHYRGVLNCMNELQESIDSLGLGDSRVPKAFDATSKDIIGEEASRLVYVPSRSAWDQDSNNHCLDGMITNLGGTYRHSLSREHERVIMSQHPCLAGEMRCGDPLLGRFEILDTQDNKILFTARAIRDGDDSDSAYVNYVGILDVSTEKTTLVDRSKHLMVYYSLCSLSPSGTQVALGCYGNQFSEQGPWLEVRELDSKLETREISHRICLPSGIKTEEELRGSLEWSPDEKEVLYYCASRREKFSFSINMKDRLFPERSEKSELNSQGALVPVHSHLQDKWYQWNEQGRNGGFYRFLLDREDSRIQPNNNTLRMLPVELAVGTTRSLLESAREEYCDSVLQLEEGEVSKIPSAFFVDLCRAATEPLYQYLAETYEANSTKNGPTPIQIVAQEIVEHPQAARELQECIRRVEDLLSLPGLEPGQNYATAAPILHALEDTFQQIAPKTDDTEDSEALGLLRTFDKLEEKNPGTWTIPPEVAEVAVRKSYLGGLSHLSLALKLLTQTNDDTAHAALHTAIEIAKPQELPSLLRTIAPDFRLKTGHVEHTFKVLQRELGYTPNLTWHFDLRLREPTKLAKVVELAFSKKALVPRIR
jgi:hypothetical protein